MGALNQLEPKKLILGIDQGQSLPVIDAPGSSLHRRGTCRVTLGSRIQGSYADVAEKDQVLSI